MTYVTALSTLAAAAFSYFIFKYFTSIHPYHDIHIADQQSWLLGNEGERDSGPEKQAGSRLVDYARRFKSDVYVLPEPLGASSLIAGDPALLNFVLSDVRKFPSTDMRSEFVRFVIGDGLVSARPQEHAKQRRIMGPAFTQAHIKQMTPIFTEKAQELSEKLREIVKEGGQARWNNGKPGEVGVVNVTELMDCASFDIVGKAGFGVEFECLKKGQDNVLLAKGYNRLLQASVKFDLPRILLLIVSGILRPQWIGLPIIETNRTIIEQNKQLQEFTSSVIAEKIKRITIEMEEEDGAASVTDGEKKEEEVKDLVDVIIRTNLEMKKKELNRFGRTETMSAKELEGQIQVILFAGYETSSVTTSMCLHYLAHNQPVQDRLRNVVKEYLAEINAENGDSDQRSRLSYDELQSPKLNILMNCLKETLRLAPAVTVSQRLVTEDCVGPLTSPIPTRDGKGTKTQILLKKGTRVGCCYKLASMNPLYWGPSPEEWNPDRWDNLPEAYKTTSMPGPAGLPAFSSGPASCLGARFALLEMTALMVTLISKHVFEPSSHQIVAKQVLVLRPTVIGQDIAALPLKVSNL
ncbi:hypothetical protein CBS101457_001775 [Exobasidium rhododendri]|nr:hypothetical protein CBS101457_001775 [Exobasidium rhododendri]